MDSFDEASTLEACARLIELERPLAFLDLETTGLDKDKDEIIQVGIARLAPGGEVRCYESLVRPSGFISEAVQELTGITNEMVQSASPLPEIAPVINELIGEADLCGYNIERFDLPFLEQAFTRHGLTLKRPKDPQVLDVCQIFKKKEPHTLEHALRYYTGAATPQSHRALDDALATGSVLAVQLARYGYTGRLEEIVRTVRHPHLDGEGKLKQDGEQVMLCFGKYNGCSVQEVDGEDPGYLDWVMQEIGGEVGEIIAARREKLNGEIESGPSSNVSEPLPF